MANEQWMAQSDLRLVAKRSREREQAQRSLEDAIRNARASGETYKDIAKVAGLSAQRVWQIVNEPRSQRP
jgi:hypothetical protein